MTTVPSTGGEGVLDRPGAASADPPTWPSRSIAVVSLLALIALTIAIGSRVSFALDGPILAAARTLDGQPIIWQFFSQTANIPLIVIAIVFELWLLRIRRRREALLVLVILAAVTGGSEALKQLTARPRPAGNGDGIPGVIYSFPSGHVLEATTILGMLVIRAWRSAKPLALRVLFAALVAVEVVLVGIARMALNEHYPTDLLAGLLGALVALGWYAYFTRPGGWADEPPGVPSRPRSGAPRRIPDRSELAA